MRYSLFLFYNVVGGVGWVCGMTLSGYFLGRLIPDIDKYLHLIVGLIILVSLIPVWREWRRAKK
jgi:membrane-associated protein